MCDLIIKLPTYLNWLANNKDAKKAQEAKRLKSTNDVWRNIKLFKLIGNKWADRPTDLSTCAGTLSRLLGASSMNGKIKIIIAKLSISSSSSQAEK